ncbi:beta-1,6-N-acetylglucosaminyltransferase [Algicella marina]|uniref:DUF5927 domain-containing protein n=1 Tax=Algicella marina TaxID=2683284 RepID=UPI0013793FEF|nr:beta-1,6-N-acetylglucosaminyltransferase [Algicella marina]
MIGIVILAHNHLHRVESLARYLAGQSCAVVIHIDKTASAEAADGLIAALASIPNIAFSERHHCEWGRFSLVEAALTASRQLLDSFPEATHVALISGSCLPIRPITELAAHLAEEPEADHIESVLVEQDGWVRDGLSAERFTLYFPFSFQRHRRIFDRFVDLQRKLKVRRQMPEGLSPHIGLQWWCLSRGTLQRIFDDPLLPAYKRFFKLTWIPDESFFQTLARKHSRHIINRPLTFVTFDNQGKPFTFYDDHLDLLTKCDNFFVRKIWPGADKLYEELLDPSRKSPDPATRSSDPMLKAVTRSVNLRSRGRPGLINQNRYTSRWYEQVFATARPYYVFDGFDRLFPRFLEGLRESEGLEMHGHLYAADKVEFIGDAQVFAGNLIASPPHRDYRPDQFLVNLVWGRRQILQGFLHDFGPSIRLRRHILRDPNAQIVRIAEGWMLAAYLHSRSQPDMEAVFFGLFRSERENLTKGFEEWDLKADILEIPLLALLNRPLRTARSIQTVLPPDTDIAPALSHIAVPEGFPEFLERMASEGFDIPEMEPLLAALRRQQKSDGFDPAKQIRRI